MSTTKFDVTDFRQEWLEEYNSCSTKVITHDYFTQFVVNGKVVDEREVAIANAVFMKGQECIGFTKTDGTAVLWLESGSYEITVYHIKYAPTSIIFEVHLNGTSLLPVTLLEKFTYLHNTTLDGSFVHQASGSIV